jgi:hypothetical protein
LTFNPGTLSPNFSSATTAYTATLPAGTTTFSVTPTVTEPNATVKVNGLATASGTASALLTVGTLPFAVSVVVTAQNGTTTSTYTVTVNNFAPAFADYACGTPFQTAAAISRAKLLAKASDANGDTLTITAVGPASSHGGRVTLQTSAISYTPPNGFSGIDDFPVTIADSRGGSVTGTVTVTVGPAPDTGGPGSMTLNPPQLTAQPDGSLAVSFRGIPGRTYQIQRSTDLATWTVVATVSASGTGAITWTDPAPPQPNAYYRLALP